jgi:hypothetical protein
MKNEKLVQMVNYTDIHNFKPFSLSTNQHAVHPISTLSHHHIITLYPNLHSVKYEATFLTQ